MGRRRLSYELVQRNADGKFLTNNPATMLGVGAEPRWSQYRRFAYGFYAHEWVENALKVLPFEPEGYKVVTVGRDR